MRRKRQQGGESSEGAGWLVTYSDMVTLLLTFFVLMYAISATDSGKFELFFASLQEGGLTDEQFLAIQLKHGMIDIDGADTVADPDNPPPIPKEGTHPDPWEDYTFTTPPEDGNEEEDENAELAELARMLETYLFENGLEHTIFLHQGEGQGDNLLITLPSEVWFDSGSADISPEMEEVAVMLAQLFSDIYNPGRPFRIAVSGHTDTVPQNTPQFPTNWHLSHGRATNFAWILIDGSEIPPGQFYTQGYGEERPVADNETEEGRQRNRRVEILISQTRAEMEGESDETEESEEIDGIEESGESDETGEEASGETGEAETAENGGAEDAV